VLVLQLVVSRSIDYHSYHLAPITHSGRPFALKGDYYANIFVHFAPYFEELTDQSIKKPSDEL